MDSFLTPYGLSNSGQEKLQFTPFWGGPKPVCSDGLRAETIESHNLFVLGFILVKFHIRTCVIESFPTIFWTWWCGEEKLHFTPVHTLRQLKRDEALIPPLGGRRVSSEVRLGNCTQVWGWAKFKERGTHGWGKIVLHTCSDLPRLVRTYVLLMQWPCTLVSQCHFLHFRTLLFFSNFLVLRLALLKIAYFNSGNRQLPSPCCSKSCGKEKLSIPLEEHHNA